MESIMNDLPEIVSKNNLIHSWKYICDNEIIAIVARYEDHTHDSKKWYRQYMFQDIWQEGSFTPLPIYGLESIEKNQKRVYVFEGEKTCSAAHSLELSAITSMRGGAQANLADWSILAKYRHIEEFILVPDNDSTGYNYMMCVHKELLKACPQSKICVCSLPLKEKGSDFIDWIQSQSYCPNNWDGYQSIDEPYSNYLRNAFLDFEACTSMPAKDFFKEKVELIPFFENDPESMEDVDIKVMPCPTDTLPKEIVQWIRGLALQLQVPEDFLIAPLMVYLGSIIGRKRGLLMRPNTRWVEFPNLWGMIVGPPASLKSPSLSNVKAPLNSLVKRANYQYDVAHKKYQGDLEQWKMRKKVFDDLFIKSIKEDLQGKIKNAKITSLEEMPQEPKIRRYKTEDATVEKIAMLLIDNPQGLLYFRDELTGLLLSFSKPGRENDRQFFLESWDGKQDFSVDRVGRGSIYVPALCLSIMGGIQPGPLSQYISSTLKGGVGDDGLLQRFQIMVWPDPITQWELVDGIDIHELEKPIFQIFEFLDTLSFNEEGEPVILCFSIEAQKRFDEWQKCFEEKLRSQNLPKYMEAHLTKYKKLLPALCLILEHTKTALENKKPSEITIKTLNEAIIWLDYFESHATRVYENGTHAILKASMDLINRIIKDEVKEPFTIRDIYFGKHWKGLTNPQQVEEVCSFLEERNYIKGRSVATGGRSTMKYWLNPKVREQASNVFS